MYYMVENTLVDVAIEKYPAAIQKIFATASEYVRLVTKHPWLAIKLRVWTPEDLEGRAIDEKIIVVEPIRSLATLQCLAPHPMRGELVEPDSLIVIVQGVTRPSIVGQLVAVANRWGATYVSFDKGTNPHHREAVVASEGAIISTSTHVHDEHVEQFVRYLHLHGVEVVTLVAEEQDTPGDAEYPWDVELRRRPLAIVVGNRDGNVVNKGVYEQTHQYVKLPPEGGTGIVQRLESLLHEVQIQRTAR